MSCIFYFENFLLFPYDFCNLQEKSGGVRRQNNSIIFDMWDQYATFKTPNFLKFALLKKINPPYCWYIHLRGIFRFAKGSLIRCTMSLNIPSTRCNGPYPSRENHPQTLILPPPPSFRRHGITQTNKLYLDSSSWSSRD
jgi:hypothetical protein